MGTTLCPPRLYITRTYNSQSGFRSHFRPETTSTSEEKKSIKISYPFFLKKRNMGGVLLYLLATISAVLILSFFYFLLSGTKGRKILATPTISEKNAVLTIYKDIRINAPADEVFSLITHGKAPYSSVIKYQWDSVSEDGTPKIGSKGNVSVSLSHGSYLFTPIPHIRVFRIYALLVWGNDRRLHWT